MLSQNYPLTKPQGKISGYVVEGSTGLELEYAVITLFKGEDSLPASGTLSDAKGFFKIDLLGMGTYRLQCTYIGFDPIIINDIKITENYSPIFYEKIEMAVVVSLNEVEITAERQMLETGIDKKVYNVGKDLASVGGTVADILQNVPSVTLDMDRNVQLRGSTNVNILIDGKPSTLSGRGGLDQMPANMIEKIEVITNPSAKFDPDGIAGIINIITKKQSALGLNGNIAYTIGTGNKNTASLGLNYRAKKFNAYLNANGLYNRMFSNSSLQWTSTLDSISTLEQEADGVNFNLSGTANGGIDFYLDKNSTLSFYGLYNPKAGWGYSNIDYEFKNNAEVLTGTQKRRNDTETQGPNYEGAITFRRNFNKEGQNLMADLTVSGSNALEGLEASQDYLTGFSLPNYQQITTTDRQNLFITPQINYTYPFGKNQKMEVGAKAILRTMDNDFRSKNLNDSTLLWTDDTGISNHFIYTDNILSAYAVWSGARKSFGYSLGLRAEQTYYQVNQKTMDSVYNNQYFNFFPSAHLKYKMKNAQEWGLGYSRRINRPSAENLNPFPEWRDPYNLMYGNPYLVPEFIHSVEASYKTFIKKVMIMPSFFYRYIEGNMFRYRRIDSANVSRVTFENLSTAQEVGGEIVLNAEITKWWNMNGSYNYYYRVVDASNLEAGQGNNGFAGNLRIMSNFKFCKNTSLQVMYMYMFPFVAPQGRGSPGSWLDIGVKKDFLKDKLSATLRVSDLFNTKEFNFVADANSFIGAVRWKRESRIVYAGLTLRFGKANSPETQKRPKGDDSQGGEGGF